MKIRSLITILLASYHVPRLIVLEGWIGQRTDLDGIKDVAGSGDVRIDSTLRPAEVSRTYCEHPTPMAKEELVHNDTPQKRES